MWDIFGCHENIFGSKVWRVDMTSPSSQQLFRVQFLSFPKRKPKKTTCLATMYICDLHWLSEWYLMSDCQVVAMLPCLNWSTSTPAIWCNFYQLAAYLPGELLHRLAACPMHRKFEDVPTTRSVPTKESCKYYETWMPMPFLSFWQVTGLTHNQVCSSHESFSMGFGSWNHFPW